jgi:ABC-2 type transport system permease protein
VRLLAARILLMTVRDPMVWLPNLIFSVFLLLAFDGILGDAVAPLTGGNYLNFLVPLIVLMAAFAGGHAGFALVTDKESGFFRRELAMPLARPAIVLGPMVAGAIQILVQSVVVLTLALIMGLDPAAGPSGVLLVLALAMLWGLAYAGYTVAMGLKARSAQAAESSTIIAFLVLFLSPIFLPKEDLQEWMQVVATINPVTYLLEAMRSLTIEGWEAGPLLRGFAVGLALAAAMLGWATRVARRVTSPS